MVSAPLFPYLVYLSLFAEWVIFEALSLAFTLQQNAIYLEHLNYLSLSQVNIN